MKTVILALALIPTTIACSSLPKDSYVPLSLYKEQQVELASLRAISAQYEEAKQAAREFCLVNNCMAEPVANFTAPAEPLDPEVIESIQAYCATHKCGN